MLLAMIPVAPVYALMAFGVVMATIGHIAKEPRVVGLGIFVLFAGTILLFVGAHQAYQQQGPIVR